jgi:hypothetical protein
LWPAIMIAEGASDEEDFAGFNVHNKETVHEIVLMSKKLDPSNPECEVRSRRYGRVNQRR